MPPRVYQCCCGCGEVVSTYVHKRIIRSHIESDVVVIISTNQRKILGQVTTCQIQMHFM